MKQNVKAANALSIEENELEERAQRCQLELIAIYKRRQAIERMRRALGRRNPFPRELPAQSQRKHP